MADDELQKQFTQKVNLILEKIRQNERASIEAALELLKQAQADVSARIAAGGTEYNLSVLRQVERGIARRIEELQRELELQVARSLTTAAELGFELSDEPIRLVTTPVIGVSTRLAQTAAQYSADLIADLSSDLLTRINGILRRAALGGVSTSDAINQVGRSLTEAGPFRSIARRAETIVRTEVMRVQAIATQARMEANAARLRAAGYKMQKAWTAAKDARVRQHHADANGQRRDVEEFFNVGGENLLFPRDPRGSAKNTINCRCVSRPVIERAYVIDRNRKFER